MGYRTIKRWSVQTLAKAFVALFFYSIARHSEIGQITLPFSAYFKGYFIDKKGFSISQEAFIIIGVLKL